MADLSFDGLMKVSFVPTIANIAAPTVVEVNAGTDLTPRLTPDGLNISTDTNSIDSTKMSSTANAAKAGRRTFTCSVTYTRGTAAPELAVETALVYRATGYLVVRRDVAYATAYAAAQKVEVYPVELGEPNPTSPAPDTLQNVEVPMYITGQPQSYSSRVALV
jgi:hypothetical protein